MAIIRRSQMPIRDVCIDLRRRNITVTQKGLNRTRVSAVLQEMSGEAVTQRVWRNVLESRLFGVPPDHGPCEVSRERPAAMQKNVR